MTGIDPVRATILRKRLATRLGACGGRYPRAGQEERRFCRYHRMPKVVPPGKPRGEPPPATIGYGSLYVRRTVGGGHR